MEHLDDTAKTCIYIPPDQLGTNDADTLPPSDHQVRMSAYRIAWRKCLNRVRAILRDLHEPVVNQVERFMNHAYDDVLPGLPYPELPVVALTGSNPTLLSEIVQHLRSGDHDADSELTEIPTLQVHLYPAECSNVMNMMRLIVTGFVDHAPGAARKRKATSLANFDINLLRAWFVAQDRSPRLAIFLHEFEKFDVSVVQDVFYICSMHVPRLPLTFALVMSSPPTPSFLHTAYSRSTLTLLRVHQVTAPVELATVKHVLTKTFFDPDFEPDVMFGVGALEYIVDFAARHTASPDALITMLQLVHMKHFSQSLSVFVQDQLLGTATVGEAEEAIASSHSLLPLIDAVHHRILATSQGRDQEQMPAAPQTPSELLACVSTARATFQRSVRRMRTAYAVARVAERVALGDAPHDANVPEKTTEGRARRLDNLDTLSAILRGRAGPQVRYVCMAIRKLPPSKLRDLLRELHSFWFGLQNTAVRRDEEEARTWIVQMLYDLPDPAEETPGDDVPPVHSARTKQLAADVGDRLQLYIEERLVRLEDCMLWDIWYTGAVPFPSELINPAHRPTVVAALLHPQDFLRAHADIVRASNAQGSSKGGEVAEAAVPSGPSGRGRALWELPDTSIAFRRYLEAGRMVNVFDWFESFAVVLESQRRHLRRRRAAPSRASSVHSSGKGKGKGKSRAGSRNTDREGDSEIEEDEDEAMDEEEEEKWKIQVQARFIRALHELDFMGFVKHTGRKADHVIRTIYDVPD